MGTALLIAIPAVGSPPQDAGAAPSARGQLNPKTLLVVRTASDAEFAERIRTELQTTGWRIVETEGYDDRSAPEAMAKLVAEFGASAAVRVDVKSGKVDVFIVRSWGNIVETLQSEAGHFDAQVLALRTTEAVRARGLELGAASANLGASEAARDAARRLDVAERQRDAVTPKKQPDFGAKQALAERALAIEAAPAIVVSPGGLGVGVAAWLELRLEFSSTLALAATGAIPVNEHHVRSVRGEADISTRVLGMAAEINWLQRSSVTATTGLGAAAFFTSMNGTRSQPGFTVADEWVTTLGPIAYVRVGVAQLTDSLQLIALGLGGASVPEVRVAFGDVQVGRWGQPFGLLAVGIDGRVLGW